MMAITGRFLADFADFSAAVQKADVELRGMETGAGKVGTSLNRMVDGFAGRKLIQDATLAAEAVDRIGGVSKLTEKELARVAALATEAAAKLRAMGQDVPPGIQKIADATKAVGTAASGSTSLLSGMGGQLAGMFTIGAVVSFGRSVLEAGDSIQKMSDQTGLSTAEVQKLQYVAGQSSSSIDSLVGAVQNLQQRLGDENTGAAGAMAKLGIKADAFNKLGTYQQMTTLAEAVRSVKNPTDQASLAAALFGKSWKEILPAIKAGMEDIGKQAPIMADATIQSLDRAGDALTRAQAQATAWAGGSILAFEDVQAAVGDYLSMFDPAHVGVAASTLLKLQTQLADPDGLLAAFAKIPPLASAMDGALKPLNLTLAEQTRIEDELTASGKALDAADTKLIATYEAHTAKVHALADAYIGLDAIDAAKDALEAFNEAVYSGTSLAQMDTVQIAALHETLADGVAVFERHGQVAPQAMRDLLAATEANTPAAVAMGEAYSAGLQQATVDADSLTAALAKARAEADKAHQTQAETPVGMSFEDYVTGLGYGASQAFAEAKRRGYTDFQAQQIATGAATYDDYPLPSKGGGTQTSTSRRPPGVASVEAGGVPSRVGSTGGAPVVNNTIYVNGTAVEAANKIMAILTQQLRLGGKFPAA